MIGPYIKNQKLYYLKLPNFQIISGHDNLPCVKAFRSVFGKFSKEIRSLIFEFITQDLENMQHVTSAEDDVENILRNRDEL